MLYMATFLDGSTLMCLAMGSTTQQSLLLPPVSSGPFSSSLKKSSGFALWYDLLRHDEIGWKLLRRQKHHEIVSKASNSESPTVPHQLYGTMDRLRRLGAASGVAWHPLPRPNARLGAPPAMEGHAACLLDDRWMVMVGGFTSYGVRNDVFVLDTWAPLSAPHPEWIRFPGPGVHQRQEPGDVYDHAQAISLPVYGHVCCPLGPRHVAVFGGVTMGGYQGDINDFYLLELNFEEVSTHGLESDGLNGKRGGVNASNQGGSGKKGRSDADSSNSSPGTKTVCRSVRVLRPSDLLGQPLTSRAYATMTLLSRVDSSSPALSAPLRLLILGGIHQGQAILQPEVLTFLGAVEAEGEMGRRGDAGSWEVTCPRIPGPEPSVRMGHSCSFLPRLGCVVVVGGSNGSDLLRNGRELLNDVSFILLEEEETQGIGKRGGGGGRPEKAKNRLLQPVCWKDPLYWGSRAPIMEHETFTGRTHTAHLLREDEESGRVVSKVIFFGGDARLSDAVGLLEVEEVVQWVGGQKERTKGDYKVGFSPLRSLTRRPSPRLSHASVLVGDTLLVHGGWCEYERGDMHSLCLAPKGVPPTHVPASRSLSQMGARMVDGLWSTAEEDSQDSSWHGEEEEEEEEMSEDEGEEEGEEEEEEQH